MGGDKDFKFGR